ncbi:hypothetical protein CSA37_11080 [Candidatus Fermentibacteria bacterium]|nr:MAG: hypothetical protein CSA37_11080 [Candidatus Fermentibacteria bacterium]
MSEIHGTVLPSVSHLTHQAGAVFLSFSERISDNFYVSAARSTGFSSAFLNTAVSEYRRINRIPVVNS